jgi:hypothetical protein
MDDLIDEDVADVVFETPREKGKRPGTILRPPPEKKLRSLLVRLPAGSLTKKSSDITRLS